MSRAKADWDWGLVPADSKFGEPLPSSVVRRLLRAMRGADRDSKKMMIECCTTAASRHHDRYLLNYSEPTTGRSNSQKYKAAECIANEARNLAQKLPGMGGVQHIVGEILRERGFPCDPVDYEQRQFFSKLRETLEQLSEAADEAKSYIETEPKALPAREELARDIAFAYAVCFGESPRATVGRENGQAHRYVEILIIMLEFCLGRRQFITAVENVARTGIKTYSKQGAAEVRANRPP